MASSPPTPSPRRSVASLASLRRSDDQHRHLHHQHHLFHHHHQHHRHQQQQQQQQHGESAAQEPPISIDTLVNHLLVSKRSLSSMNLVLRANELATAARAAHQETVILDAQTAFLRGAIVDQMAILVRVRRSLHATYDWGKRDFKHLIRAMDEADGELAATMDMLGRTDVHRELWPSPDDRRNLLDFVDETSVHAMREAMKKSIEELQGIQQSFDGDLLRFETDIRELGSIVGEAGRPDRQGEGSSPEQEQSPSTAELLLIMDEHSSAMAQLLTSLTKHFDMCVTAIRTTEGAAALARRKAAEVTPSQPGGGGGGGDAVSISGVIAEQESHVSGLEPETAEDRAEMLRVVTQDADEVDDVVGEIQERLAAVEAMHSALEARARAARAAHAAILSACAALGDIGDRLADYLAAEDDFRTRWELEKGAVVARLGDMADMRDFYEGYASAYGSLVLEVERRRTVERQVEAQWRKAREAVDRLLDADRAAREAFRLDVGEFLPTDLWAATQTPASRWTVVRVPDGQAEQPDPSAAAPEPRQGSRAASPAERDAAAAATAAGQ